MKMQILQPVIDMIYKRRQKYKFEITSRVLNELDSLLRDVLKLKNHKCPECGADITEKVNRFLERQTQLKDGQVFDGETQTWGYQDSDGNHEIDFDDKGPRCAECEYEVSIFVSMMAEVR